jgi:hypothetical protein
MIALSALTGFMSSCNQIENSYDLEAIGSVALRTSYDIEDSYWGIQASTLDPELLEKMTEIGVKWTRLGASWPSIERQRGAYNWEQTDAAFQAMMEANIIPFVTLGSGNELYTAKSTYDDPKLAEIYGYRPGPPTQSDTAMEAWLKYVEATVDRYKDKIRYWEIWNEPNHRNYWGAPPNAKDYGTLVNQTARLIKSIHPEAIIIAGSMAGLDPDFIDGFLSMDEQQFIDIISYHNYGAIPEKRIYRAYEAWEVIKKYNPDIELWQGECGYPSHSSSRDYRGISPWGLNIQSKWLLRQAFTDIFFCNATMSNYFKLVHDRGYGEKPERSFLRPVDSILGFPERGGSRVKTVGINEKCLLANPDFEPKPAFYVYQNLCSLMDKEYKAVEVRHTIEVTEQGQFYGIGPYDDAFPSKPLLASFVNGDDQNLVAYWLPWHPQEYIREPASVNILSAGLTFADPVLVDLMDGMVYDISSLEGVPLMDYPLIIMERDAMDLDM